MRYIIGLGNRLRAEDAFGLDVVSKLESFSLLDTKCLLLSQLIPELVLELVDASEIIFIDACYSLENDYILACTLLEEKNIGLSHQISYKVILSMLSQLYTKRPKYQIYSMFTKNFENFENVLQYEEKVQQVVNHLLYK